MASDVGELKVKLSFDEKGFSTAQKNIESKTKGWGKRIAGVGKTIGTALAAGFSAASAAATAFAKSSIDAFNVQEQAMAKLEQSAKNQNWYEGATKDLMAYNAELQKTGIIGDEVNAAGQAQLGTFALSAEAVKKLTPAMDDLLAATSGYGTTTDNATQMANLMGKVMTGNVGALTRYGVTLDENQKKLLQEGDEMTRAATLAEVLAQNYGGFNEKLAQTPQGQITQLSNDFGDLKEQFGAFIAGKGDLDGFFEQIGTVFERVSKLITTMAPQVTEGIGTLFEVLMTEVPLLLQELLPEILTMVVDLFVRFLEFVPDLTQELINLLGALVAALTPQIPRILKAVIDGIIGFFLTLSNPENIQMLLQATIELFMALVQAIPQIIQSLAVALPTIITNIIMFLTDPKTIGMLIKAAVALFLSLVKAIPQILGALLGAFGTLFGNLWNGLQQRFRDFAGNFGKSIAGVFKGAINGVLSFIEGFINAPIRLINGFIGTINSAFGAVGVNIGTIGLIHLPRMAEGGLVTSATTAIVGEAGREAVLPLDRNTGWASILAEKLAEEMDEGAGREIVVNMTNNINNKLDAQEIGQLMMTSIRRAAA